MALKTWNKKGYQITGQKTTGPLLVGSFMESWGSSRVGDNRVGHLFDSDFFFSFLLEELEPVVI
jgi:hypothetical protein